MDAPAEIGFLFDRASFEYSDSLGESLLPRHCDDSESAREWNFWQKVVSTGIYFTDCGALRSAKS